MTASFAKTVTEADLANFAGVSTDFNPLHMDEEFAAGTRFKGRIAHGMLSGAYLSAILGMQLPGPGAVYLEQSIRFRAPVRIGDRLRSRVEVTALMPEKNIATFRTECLVGNKRVVSGEATLLVPSKAAQESGGQ